MLKRVEVAGGRPKRLVSVGVIPPKEIDAETIYIDLSEKPSEEGREIEARAFSRRRFEYMGDSRLSGYSTQLVSNFFMKEVTIPYNQFIEGIAEANSAEVSYGRLVSDSLTLTAEMGTTKKTLETMTKRYGELMDNKLSR